MAKKNDPRVSHEGAAIRTLRVQELPSLPSVHIGDYWFVGPTPERKVFAAEIASKSPPAKLNAAGEARHRRDGEALRPAWVGKA